MKQQLLLCVAGLILLSSCAGTGIMKRRYTKGYYVSHNKTVAEPEKRQQVKTADIANQQNTTPAKALTVSETQTIAEPTRIAIGKSATNSHEIKTTQRAIAPVKNQQHLFASASQKTPEVTQTEIRPLQLNTSNSGKGSSDSSKVELVLMVILCLFPFINLIPVYLHDNAITLNFWITLILDFTYIGGVIFALLVVLDVVNLAK